MEESHKPNFVFMFTPICCKWGPGLTTTYNEWSIFCFSGGLLKQGGQVVKLHPSADAKINWIRNSLVHKGSYVRRYAGSYVPRYAGQVWGYPPPPNWVWAFSCHSKQEDRLKITALALKEFQFLFLVHFFSHCGS